ncbi:putative RNA-binding protein with PUA-like domain [Bradyrhizobium sp. USDA 10063]
MTMAAIKTDKKLADMALVKYSWLSVQPVTPEEWNTSARRAGCSGSRTLLSFLRKQGPVTTGEHC